MVDIDQNTDAVTIPLFKPNQLPHRKVLSEKGLKAQRIVKKYSVIAGGIGIIPFTRFSGQIAIAGLLLKLLRDLCRLYGVSFTDQQGKILIAAILGGAHYGWISRYLMRFIRDYAPVLHSPAALVLRPAVSGLLVLYIGKLFLIHLESGVWHAAIERKTTS